MAALGRLAIAVEADIASFTSDMGKVDRVAKRTAASMEKSLRTAAAATGVALAAAGASIIGMARSAIQAADQMDEMSQKVGLSAKTLSELKFAASQSGVSIEQLQTGLVRLSRSAADAAGGGLQAVKAFQAIGVSVRDAQGSLRGTDAILSDLAGKFRAMEDGAAKTALATRLFGRAGADLLPFLNQGSEGIARLSREAAALGVVIGNDTAAAAGQFNDNMDKLRDSFTGLTNDLAREFLPALVEATRAMVEWVKQLRETGAIQRIIEAVKSFIAVLDDLAVFLLTRLAAGAIARFVGSIALATTGLGLAATATAAWTATLAVLGGPIGLLLTGVAALATAIYAYSSSADDAARAAAALDTTQRRLAESTGYQIEGALEAAKAERDRAEATLQAARADLVAARAAAERYKQIPRTPGDGMGGTGAAGGLGFMQGANENNITAIQSAVDKLALSFSNSNIEISEGEERLAAFRAGLVQTETPIVDLTNGAQKAADEIAKLREQAEAFANQTILAMLTQFDPLLAIQLKYEESLRNLAPLLDGTAEGERLYAEALAAVVRMKDADVAATRKEIAETKRQQNVVGLLAAEYAEQNMVMRMSAREAFVYAETQRAIGDAIAANRPLIADQIDQIGEMAGEMFDSTEEFEKIQDILSEFGDNDPFGDLIDKIKDLRAEIEELPGPMDEAFDPAKIAEMRAALGNLRQEALMFATDAIGQGISNLKSMASEGSNAYKALEVAQAALNLTTAIGAIVNQGMGDPYTAFARMAAMAAAVSQLVGSLGAFGGGFSDTAAQRQGAQGTGSVLGDADAKSESIANAVEITADASEKLVGLNRGMLNALVAMQNSIGSATAMLARGSGDVEFSDLPSVGGVGAALRNPIRYGGLLGGLLGGSSEITDQGIVIFGGALLEILENISVGAYQEVQSRGWIFGGRDTSEEIVDVTDELGNQFQLIIDSIVNTVREGAIALGMLPDEIEAALAAFQVEEIRISLMDLTAEEQQAELEAVFGQIFDGLAGHVVPFIAQFQQVGEGLGETLVRVATGVQVTREAINQLGIAIDEADPERFAQISEGLIGAVGSIEDFITGMVAFVNNFATDAHRFEVAQNALTSAFAQAGLEIPETRDAMWELMQSLDATTEEGQAQIATLLRLADVADEYYNALEDQAEAMIRAAAATQELERFLGGLARDGWSEPMQQIMALDDTFRQHVATIQELAIASGRAEASEAELSIAREWHTRQLRKLAREIMQSAMDIAAQLGYEGFEGAANDPIYDADLGGIGQVTQAVEDRYARELQLLQQLDQYVRSLGISALSPLNPTERLGEAQAEYQRLLALAQGGDLDALGQLQGAANAYLTEAQSYFGGVGAYEGIFESVRDTLAALVEAGPQSEQLGPNTPVFGGPVDVNPGDGMREMNEIERALLAQQLVDHLAALSIALNEPILALFETMGIPLTQLVEDLGINIEEITGASVEALAQLAYDLGLPLGELVTALGLELPDLADGVRELAASLDIDLNALTAETYDGLVALANTLNTELATLTQSLGIDLGRLTDVNSPIFQALDRAIEELSPDIRDQLDDLLIAITTATNEADANAAIAAAELAINGLPAGIRDLLAPFFEGVDPVGAFSDLDYLDSIDDTAEDMLAELQDIAEALNDANEAAGIPGYAQGTPWVPNNGPAMLHQGEMVIPRDVSDRIRSGDYYLGGTDFGTSSGGDDPIARKLDLLTQQNAQLLTAIANNTKVTADEARKPRPMGRAA
jgi:hypothetical protein